MLDWWGAEFDPATLGPFEHARPQDAACGGAPEAARTRSVSRGRCSLPGENGDIGRFEEAEQPCKKPVEDDVPGATVC